MYTYVKGRVISAYDPLGNRTFGIFSGQVCNNSCNDDEIDDVSYFPEDSGWNQPGSDLADDIVKAPEKGQCADADVYYDPRGAMKIPDTCTIHIDCCDGERTVIGVDI